MLQVLEIVGVSPIFRLQHIVCGRGNEGKTYRWSCRFSVAPVLAVIRTVKRSYDNTGYDNAEQLSIRIYRRRLLVVVSCFLTYDVDAVCGISSNARRLWLYSRLRTVNLYETSPRFESLSVITRFARVLSTSYFNQEIVNIPRMMSFVRDLCFANGLREVIRFEVNVRSYFALLSEWLVFTLAPDGSDESPAFVWLSYQLLGLIVKSPET